MTHVISIYIKHFTQHLHLSSDTLHNIVIDLLKFSNCKWQMQLNPDMESTTSDTFTRCEGQWLWGIFYFLRQKYQTKKKQSAPMSVPIHIHYFYLLTTVINTNAHVLLLLLIKCIIFAITNFLIDMVPLFLT